MSTWRRRFLSSVFHQIGHFSTFLPASSSNHNYKDGNENTEIYEHNKYFELEQHISSSAFFFSFVAVISYD